MSGSLLPDRWLRRLRGLVRGYVDLSYRRPWIPLLFIAVATAAALWTAQKLRIDTDLRVLLPEGTPSKEAIEEAEKRKGSTDLFTLAMEASSLEALGRFQKAAAESVAAWPEAVWVQYDQDRSFFEKQALLYLPVSELEDLRDRVGAMIGSEFASRNPLIESLDDEEAPASLDGWPDREALRREGLPEDIVTALLNRVEGRDSAAAGSRTGQDGNGSEPPRPDSLSSRLMGWHPEKKVWVAVVLAQLTRPSTDAQYAKEVYEKGEALVARMDPARFAPDLVAKVAGAYRNFSEIDQVNTDVVTAGTISLVLILALLWFFVRKPASLLLINTPLFVAMAWAMGITYLVYQRLTLLTAFILALILGLGIEYAVHLYARWAEEAGKKKDAVSAMTEAMLATGRALIAGAATNVFAMLSLQVGHFQGFREFGVVVSIGVTLALVGNWIVMPPLFFAAMRLAGRLERALGFSAGRAAVRWLLPTPGHLEGGILLPRLPLSRRVLVALATCAAMFTLAISFGPGVEFENDFRNLRGKSTGAGISYGRAVGAGRNTSPAVILGQNEAQLRSVHDSLAARYGNPADSMLKSFVTVQSFVPSPEEQRKRGRVLEQIRDQLGARALQRADSAARADLERLRGYLDARPFRFEDLPDWARRFLTEADGSHGRMGYLYAEMRESDAVESAKFQDRFQFLPSEQGPVPVASTGFIYADVVRMVKGDGPILAVATLILLIVVTTLDMRNWRGVAIAVGFIALSAFWTFKLMGFLGLRLGMFNLVVLPTILSVSVDSVIHLYHRRLALGAGRIVELYRTTGSAVLTGTLNNFFGFFGLCFVSHKGMQSIGFMATLGIGCGLLVMFTALPAALEFLCPKEPVKEAGAED